MDETKIKYLSYGLLVFSILLFVFSLFFTNSSISSWEVYASVNVSRNTLGFDVNESALTFGKVPPGSIVSRNVIFANTYGFPVMLDIKAEGDISRYLDFQEKIVVESQESKMIGFTLNIPEDINEGFYDGHVTFNVKASNRLISKIFKNS